MPHNQTDDNGRKPKQTSQREGGDGGANRPRKTGQNDFIISSKGKKNGIKNVDDLKVRMTLLIIETIVHQ